MFLCIVLHFKIRGTIFTAYPSTWPEEQPSQDPILSVNISQIFDIGCAICATQDCLRSMKFRLSDFILHDFADSRCI